MNRIQRIIWSCVGVLALIGCIGDRGYWYFSVVNSGTIPTEVNVSGAKGPWTIAPGEAKTIKIDGQPDSDHGKERTFTIATGGKTETLKVNVNHPDIMLLDITGTSCVVAADYGPQYRPKEMPLPDGASDIAFIKSFQGQRLYTIGRLPSKRSAEGSFVMTNLGEKLPDSIKLSKGSTDMPEHIRLVQVPCDLIQDNRTLYTYLNDH
ncbi:MAG: hypothetical protein HY543_08170 [Deltaproteobacteria bacterium]|nr:hypothetical protein [Deltaproteobacteria bacterium]